MKTKLSGKKKTLANQILDKNVTQMFPNASFRTEVLRSMEEYAIKRVIQVKKQLAQEVIDDCNNNYPEERIDNNTGEYL